jgi:hypothetical protein
MPEKCPEYTSTSEATAIWRNKLSKFNTIGYFGRRPCSIAKGVFATKAIRNVTLTPDKAKISAYFNGENIDFDLLLKKSFSFSISRKKITEYENLYKDYESNKKPGDEEFMVQVKM